MSKNPLERDLRIGRHNTPKDLQSEIGMSDESKIVEEEAKETGDGIKYLIFKIPEGLAEETSFPFKDLKQTSSEENPFKRNFASSDIPPISNEEE